MSNFKKKISENIKIHKSLTLWKIKLILQFPPFISQLKGGKIFLCEMVDPLLMRSI